MSSYEKRFNNFPLLGRGTSGEVRLVSKSDGSLFAMRSLIRDKRNTRLARAESNILREIKSHWVVKFDLFFEEEHYWRLLMEYLPGGNLLALLRYDVLSEDVAKFYMTETVLAIEAVHQFRIIHRYSPTLNLVEELLM